MSNSSVQSFLDMLIKLIESNPLLQITEKLVYAQMVSFRLGDSVIPFENVEKFFRNWITSFQNNPTVDVYRDRANPFICRFSSKREGDTKIKLYVPLDSEHIKDGVIEIFSFLIKENIIHDSKVFSSIRNDNIIIKVTSIEDANKIIKFVKRNSFLSSGILNANPFLMPCYKIGVIIDNSYTYNIEIARVIASVLEQMSEQNTLQKCSVSYLKSVFTKLSVKCDDEELSDIYHLAAIVLDENSSLQDFANYVLEYQQLSYSNKHGGIDISYQNSVDYLNCAIKETFKRYNNLSFVINAVRLYVTSNNSKGFTRINQARKNLNLHANCNQLKKLFEEDNLDFSIKYYVLKVVTEDK